MSSLDRIILDKANGLQSNADGNQTDDLYNRVYSESPADTSRKLDLPVKVAVDSFKEVSDDYNQGKYNNEAAATQLMRALSNMSAEELTATSERLQKEDPNWKVSKSVNEQKDEISTFEYTYPNREIGINPVNFIDSTLGYAAHKAKNMFVGPDLQVSLSANKLAVRSTDLSKLYATGEYSSYSELYKKLEPSLDFKRNFYAK